MGKLFDVVLLILILVSVILVMLESVTSIDTHYHDLLYFGEWVITIFFTIEYILRIITVKKASNYIFSFYGIIDFLSTIPLYLSFILAVLAEYKAKGTVPKTVVPKSTHSLL